MNIIFDLIINGRITTFDTTMSTFLYWFTGIISIVFTVMYFHQIVYLIVGTVKHGKIKHPTGDVKQHKIGIVISARNEQKVIPNLIKSIQAQDYPKELLSVFVIADNCTDDTANICKEMGCVVVERQNETLVGKGYALHYFFEKMHTEESYADLVPEAYIVIDADNVLKPNYVTEMNKTFDCGYQMITSYRNSKNFSKNWISSGYGYWFLHEARHLNNCRMMTGHSCAISGTGFLIATDVVKEFDNWKFFTLTEDIQCSTEYALTGRKVAYCSTAELYDEQPISLRQSWRQRERWAKGFYQVFGLKGATLVKASFRSFSCWDILTTIMPALLITLLSLIVLPTCAIVSASLGNTQALWHSFGAILWTLGSLYVMMFSIALLVCITEWKKILANPVLKILYLFTFPLFMVTYVPIAITALFKKVKWKPIEHTADVSLEELQEEEHLQELSLEEQLKAMHHKGEKKKNERHCA